VGQVGVRTVAIPHLQSSVNLEGGYRISKRVRIAVDVFNLRSRLHGEPAGGLNDIHLHPTIPRTFRVNFVVGR
jgi:hypothetical protein